MIVVVACSFFERVSFYSIAVFVSSFILIFILILNRNQFFFLTVRLCTGRYPKIGPKLSIAELVLPDARFLFPNQQCWTEDISFGSVEKMQEQKQVEER